MNIPLLTRVQTVCGHTFFPRLGPSSTVVDLGANDGTFARRIRSLFRCRVVSAEASAEMFSRIPDEPWITRRHCAVAAYDGTVAFHVAADPLASSLCTLPPGDVRETITVQAVTLPTLLRDAGVPRVDLLKMDIEGAERAVMDSVSDAVLKEIVQLSLEFHDFCGLVTEAEVVRIRQRLISLGFYEIRFPTGSTNTLFVNLDLWNHPAAERWYVKHVSRNLQAAVRRLRAIA